MRIIEINNSISTLLSDILPPNEMLKAWQGMKDGSGWEFLNDRWFQLLGASLATILVILLYVVRQYRVARRAREIEERFDEECYQRGLTAEEHEILAAITDKSGLKVRTTIFTMLTAFNIGASKLMQEHFSSGDSIIERKKLNVAVNNIREKLGYSEGKRAHGAKRGLNKGLNSRTIPVGKKVSLSLAGKQQAGRIEGVVIKNDDYEIVIHPEVKINSLPGEVWNIRYRFGAATWEYNALTMNCTNEGIELSHSDNIRFLNRRKFLRATVKRPALIAKFPVLREAFKNMLPKFYKATLTEISGPGLRIKTDLQLAIGDRMIVVFELEQGRIIEDIAEVRGIRDTVVGRSIGVELIGLNDKAVNELVRVTNSIAILQGAEVSEEITEDMYSMV